MVTGVDAFGRSKIVIVGMGGTIAMADTGAEGAVPSLSASQLVDAVPQMAMTEADLEVEALRNHPSSSLTIEDVIELSQRIRTCLADGADGIVVTHGTDTLEESAYLLDLLHAGPQPIVITGAMRHAGTAGADGPANLLAAVRVAASPLARHLGCLVVWADEVHAASRVRKMHTASVATFASPNGGALGLLTEGRFQLLNRPVHRHVLPFPGRRRWKPHVVLYTATLGDDAGILGVIATQVDGLVVAGFGAGHVPPTWMAALEVTARRIPVVLASRTGAGPVAARTYGFAGSERDLLERGLISAGILDPYKARVLLYLALAAGGGPSHIRATFAAASGSGASSSWPWLGWASAGDNLACDEDGRG